MKQGRITPYIAAGLIFLGSQAYAQTVKQQFFDTVIEYAQKQGLRLNKLNPQNIEIKDEVKKDGEKVYGTFNKITRKIEIIKSKLENIATIGIHEAAHEKKYDPTRETELWFEKIPYKVEKTEEGYTATADPKRVQEGKIAKGLEKVIIREGSRTPMLYDDKGKFLASFEIIKIIGDDTKTLRIMTAEHPINGVQGKFYYEKENNELYYIPSDVMGFQNEIVARLYEQIFSGYYVGKVENPTTTQDKTQLGKSLTYLTTLYTLTPEQQKMSKNSEEAYKRINEMALIGIVDKTIEVGGKDFKQMMEDLQDNQFAKNIALASVLMPEHDFKALLDIYDSTNKEEINKLMSQYNKELQETRKIGNISEEQVMLEYIKRFNLNENEAWYVMAKTRARSFDEIFRSQEKLKHIEKIKQANLEKMMEQFKGKEESITKGL
ncbi:MAG: hypothetical protein V1645_02770 [archaeon]